MRNFAHANKGTAHTVNHYLAANILGYGVMVTLQILVLSFLVRVRVSQPSKAYSSRIGFFRIWKILLKMYGFKEGTEKVPCLKPYIILCFQFLLHYNLVCEQPATVHCGLALYADITCVLRSLP